MTTLVTENLFGNGVYAVVALPEKIDSAAPSAEKYWIIVDSIDRVTAFEISTEGMRVF
jgi:hypothetical protein